MTTPDAAAATPATLRRLAEAATPGPWKWTRGYLEAPGQKPPEGWLRPVILSANEDLPVIPRDADSDYIAAVSPDVVLSLLDTLAARDAEVTRLRASMQSLLLLPAKYDLNKYERLRLAVENHVEVGCISGHTGQDLVDALALAPAPGGSDAR